MTHIAPCARCPLREGCELREGFRKRAKGIDAVSIRFQCPCLGAEVRIGRRIVITAPSLSEYYCNEIPGVIVRHVEVPATITVAYPDYSFSATVDRGALDVTEMDECPEGKEPKEEHRFRRRQKHIRIVRFLDEPDRLFCASRSLLLPDGNCDQHPESECMCKLGNPAVTGASAPRKPNGEG
jgi:hypothetical protein